MRAIVNINRARHCDDEVSNITSHERYTATCGVRAGVGLCLREIDRCN